MRTIRAAAVTVLCALLLSVSAFAVVDAPMNGYVSDTANAISAETEEYINQQVDRLAQRCGAQIAIAAVDFMDGMDSESYAYEVFNTWGVGDPQENNGLLLVFAVGENKVWCMCGTGLESSLGPKLEIYLEDYFYDQYDQQNYDTAVREWFDAVYEWFDGYSVPGYSGISSGTVTNPGQPPQRVDGSPVSAVVTIVIIIIVLVILFDSMRYASYRRRYLMPGMPPPVVVYRPFIFGRPRRPRPPRPPRPPHGGGGPRPGGGSFFGGGSSRGGGAGRGGGGFRGGGRSFGGGRSRGGGAGRR